MLKPSELGVTGRKRSISAHEDLVLKKLNSLSNKKVATVCKDILQSKSGDKINIPAGVNTQHINEITNYFAEVAGPILAKPILISNKALEGATNTLKPGNVIQILSEPANSALKKKWEKTVPYKVMQVLDESNVVSGPIKAIKQFYPSTFPSIRVADYEKVIQVMSTGNEAKIPKSEVPASFMKIINENPDASANFKKHGAALASMINFLFEKELAKYSKSDSSYHELFVDATSKSVLFMKFGIDRKGVMTALISDPKESSKKAFLRSKQGVERRSSSTGKLKLDKMGFQP